MSGFKEYGDYDAIGLAGLVAAGALSQAELTREAIARIEALNPALNALISNRFEVALEDAEHSRLEGPLAGVPFVLKDLNTYCEGLPSTNGSRAFRTFLPPRDGVLIKRFKAAGLNILGKTNTPEFGLNIFTESSLFGLTLNPHDSRVSTGGSSGGSAAAVAAGMLPAAHATDSGGSIRIPASNCGLYGLKPTRARVPLGHDEPEGLAGFSHTHAVTHSVRDSALLLDLTAGSVAGDPYQAPTVAARFSDCVGTGCRDLKIALHVEGYAGEPIASDCVRAAEQVASQCEALGCTVEFARPDVDGAALRDAFDVLFSVNMKKVVDVIRALRHDEPLEDLLEPVTLAAAERGALFGAADYPRALEIVQRTGRRLGAFFEHFNVLLTPTLARPPLPLGLLDMRSDDWVGYLDGLLNEIPFTPLFNATGCPAASLPLVKSASGLPVGVQAGAAFGREDTVLRLSGALEQAHPWHGLR